MTEHQRASYKLSKTWLNFDVSHLVLAKHVLPKMLVSGAPQVVYASSPYVMPGAASISAMPMTSYTTMPMAYSTWDCEEGSMQKG